MTREEAIDELSVVYERLSHPEDCENGCYSFRDGDYLEAIGMAIEALSAPTGQWIPCSERLPERTDKYLVTVANGNVYAGTFSTFDNKFTCKAVAWMELPEAYRGE